MSKITIKVMDRKNKQHILEGKKGQTLMELIDEHKIAEPYGTCCGEPQCGTCHVYVGEEWLDKLNEKTEEEKLAIDNASELKSNSRLGCQIDLIEELNGLSVKIGPNDNQI
jgi:ferredoxin, 2Fe-2S